MSPKEFPIAETRRLSGHLKVSTKGTIIGLKVVIKELRPSRTS